MTAKKWECLHEGEHYDGTDCGVKGYRCHACREDLADARAVVVAVAISGAGAPSVIARLHETVQTLRERDHE